MRERRDCSSITHRCSLALCLQRRQSAAWQRSLSVAVPLLLLLLGGGPPIPPTNEDCSVCWEETPFPCFHSIPSEAEAAEGGPLTVAFSGGAALEGHKGARARASSGRGGGRESRAVPRSVGVKPPNERESGEGTEAAAQYLRPPAMNTLVGGAQSAEADLNAEERSAVSGMSSVTTTTTTLRWA